MEDSDKFVFSLASKGFISCFLFVKLSHQPRTRHMDVSRIIPMLDSELNRSPPCLHAFTDSDSVNALSEMGWVTILKLVRPIKSSPYFKVWAWSETSQLRYLLSSESSLAGCTILPQRPMMSTNYDIGIGSICFY